jgi:hypothetical protein
MDMILWFASMRYGRFTLQHGIKLPVETRGLDVAFIVYFHYLVGLFMVHDQFACASIEFH